MTTATTDKSLERFLNTIHTNQHHVRNNLPEHYSMIRHVDDCFIKASEHLVNPKPTFCGPLFLRSHYAYKTAAGMALGGQVTESFVIMRSCLEYAGYALAIFADPRLGDEPSREEVFVSRHVDDATMKAQKTAFQMPKIRKTISRVDPNLAKQFDLLYERCISFGAHPNPHGLFLAMNIDAGEDAGIVLNTLALTGDPNALRFTMKNVVFVGLMSLHIFEKIFMEKFEILGIRAEIDALGNTPF
jgi:hypothetical protein